MVVMSISIDRKVSDVHRFFKKDSMMLHVIHALLIAGWHSVLILKQVSGANLNSNITYNMNRYCVDL